MPQVLPVDLFTAFLWHLEQTSRAQRQSTAEEYIINHVRDFKMSKSHEARCTPPRCTSHTLSPSSAASERSSR